MMILKDRLPGILAALIGLMVVAMYLMAAPVSKAEEEKHPIEQKRPAFEKTWPQLEVKKCRATARSVTVTWTEVYGADGYEVYRSKKRDGKYRKFGETDELSFKEKSDGEFYYKVRAVRGDRKSRWSQSVRIFCMNGYIKKMYYDNAGYTHFQISLTDRTDRSALLYGPGLYNDYYTPNYYVEKWNVQDPENIEKIAHPYPRTAQLQCPMYCCREIPAGEETTVDVFVPKKLKKYGETGIGDENFEYRVVLTYYTGYTTPPYEITVTGEQTGSVSRGRIVKEDER